VYATTAEVTDPVFVSDRWWQIRELKACCMPIDGEDEAGRGKEVTHMQVEAGVGCCHNRFPSSSAIWIPWAHMSDRSGAAFGPVPFVRPVVFT